MTNSNGSNGLTDAEKEDLMRDIDKNIIKNEKIFDSKKMIRSR